MKEEKIILPDFIIADIYKHHLIQPEVEITETPPKKTSTKKNNEEKDATVVQFLGENKKQIIVLVDEAEAIFINDNELALLSKILCACNLNLADIAIINTKKYQVKFDELKEQFNAKFILLTGVKSSVIQLPFSVPDFQVQQFSNCTIISSPALSEMLTDSKESIALKRQLWNSLQKAFNLI